MPRAPWRTLLADCLCWQLTPAQVVAIQDTTSSRKQQLLRFRSFSVVPFDSTFPYLFLPDQTSTRQIDLSTEEKPRVERLALYMLYSVKAID
ncbi:hypothetical protein ZWY2020_001571 [Hordeum vulgare]|nr:hypothetical protein ZWY2020_001571 [Hordeum vulgare]